MNGRLDWFAIHVIRATARPKIASAFVRRLQRLDDMSDNARSAKKRTVVAAKISKTTERPARFAGMGRYFVRTERKLSL